MSRVGTALKAQAVEEYRCLIISPSDVEDLRGEVRSAIEKWNETIGQTNGKRIGVLRWETCAPDASAPGQEIINRDRVADAQLAVAVFWTRLGNPTGEYLSGSREEIERVLANGGRVLIYLCQRPLPHDVDTDELERVRAFIEDLQARVLYQVVRSGDELRERLPLDLTQVLATGTSQPKPNTRVRRSRNTKAQKSQQRSLPGGRSTLITGVVVLLMILATMARCVYLDHRYPQAKTSAAAATRMPAR